MAETDALSDTGRFIAKMDGELLGWEHPAAHLREALDGDHFRLDAQPIVALGPSAVEDAVEMAEVLVRLREEGARMLPPGDFLPALEHYRMITDVDRWVARHALLRLGEGSRVPRLCVNVSGPTLEDKGFAPFAAMQLRLAGLEPAGLVVEIDESDVLDRRAAAERFAAEMKGIGCRVLLDGFARRSVSFEPIKALRADYVKVDGTVIRNILRSGGAAAKLKAIVRASAATGVGVIAECVEEAEILAALRQAKVGFAQGFGIGRPQPIDALLTSSSRHEARGRAQ